MGFISVIIPVYNYGFCLEETISSLQGQTHANWEALIIDDGSSDDTSVIAKKLIETDIRIKYYYQDNRGVSAARNLGIEHAVGDYILFLDGDDLITSNKLAAQSALMGKHETVDICYTDVYYFRNENPNKLFFGRLGNRKWTIKLNGTGYEIIREFVKKNRFTIHSPLIRIGFLKDNGLKFDETLSYKEDWDFWLRCVFKGANIHYADNPTVYSLVRVHARSVSHQSVKMDMATIIIRDWIKKYVHSCSGLTNAQKCSLLKVNDTKRRGPLKKMIYYNLHSLANLRKLYRAEPTGDFFICFVKALNEKRKDFF